MSDLAFEALCEVCGIDWQAGMTQDERGRVNLALRQLRTVYPQGQDLALPQMIRERAEAWREVFPEAVLTPQSITKSWSTILEQAQARRQPVRRLAKRNPVNQHARRGCQTCGDDHMILLDDGRAAPCPDCNPNVLDYRG